MPRVHHVKKARKDNKEAGIKKGEEYWWAGYRAGRSSYRRFWKSPPRPSQVTASEFYAAVYSIQESMEDANPADIDDLQNMVAQWVSEIQDIGMECQYKLDNMPEGLQQGDTGQLLQERIDAMENWACELESVDLEIEETEDGDSEDSDSSKEDKESEAVQDKLEEIRGIDPGI